MPRWYAGFQAIGNAPVVIEQIRSVVQHHNLSRFVPLVRVEKRPRGQFHVFVAIESATMGAIPPEVEPLLHLHNLTRPPGYSFTLDQIKSMVSGPMDVRDYVRTITYVPPARPVEPDPYAAPGGELPPDQQDEIIQRSQRYDRLWMWLSAMGSGTWTIFQHGSHVLGVDRDGMTARRVLRQLRLLGHLECSRDGRAWSVAPTTLLRLGGSATDATYLLCGQRSAPLLEALRAIADVEVIPQPGGLGPATVRICADDMLQIAAYLAESNVESPFHVLNEGAERFALALPALSGWMSSLQVMQGISPSLFEVKRFDGSIFVPAVFVGKAGFYELWHSEAESGAQHPAYSLFYDATCDRWLRGDWYGLRFLAFQQRAIPCPYDYEDESRRLYIPGDFRWPEIYERALVLASGRLPEWAEGWLLYEGVSAELLETLRTKLALKRVEDDDDA